MLAMTGFVTEVDTGTAASYCEPHRSSIRPLPIHPMMQPKTNAADRGHIMP